LPKVAVKNKVNIYKNKGVLSIKWQHAAVFLECDHKWDLPLNGTWMRNCSVSSSLKCPSTVQLHHQICDCEKDMSHLLGKNAFLHFAENCPESNKQLSNYHHQGNIHVTLAVLKDTWCRKVYIHFLGIWTCNYILFIYTKLSVLRPY
jgi:hypothetical protein